MVVPLLERSNTHSLSFSLSLVLDKGTIKLKVSVNCFTMLLVKTWRSCLQPHQTLLFELLRHKHRSRSAASTKEEATFVRGRAKSKKNKAQSITARLSGPYSTEANPWLIAQCNALCCDCFMTGGAYCNGPWLRPQKSIEGAGYGALCLS